jgi:CspA family cold shock protein
MQEETGDLVGQALATCIFASVMATATPTARTMAASTLLSEVHDLDASAVWTPRLPEVMTRLASSMGSLDGYLTMVARAEKVQLVPAGTADRLVEAIERLALDTAEQVDRSERTDERVDDLIHDCWEVLGRHGSPDPAPNDGQRPFRGTVKWFSADNGYGFIAADHGEDVFVHFSQLEYGVASLVEGQSVAFDVTELENGPMAVDVRVLT